MEEKTYPVAPFGPYGKTYSLNEKNYSIYKKLDAHCGSSAAILIPISMVLGHFLKISWLYEGMFLPLSVIGLCLTPHVFCLASTYFIEKRTNK